MPKPFKLHALYPILEQDLPGLSFEGLSSIKKLCFYTYAIQLLPLLYAKAEEHVLILGMNKSDLAPFCNWNLEWASCPTILDQLLYFPPQESVRYELKSLWSAHPYLQKLFKLSGPKSDILKKLCDKRSMLLMRKEYIPCFEFHSIEELEHQLKGDFAKKQVLIQAPFQSAGSYNMIVDTTLSEKKKQSLQFLLKRFGSLLGQEFVEIQLNFSSQWKISQKKFELIGYAKNVCSRQGRFNYNLIGPQAFDQSERPFLTQHLEYAKAYIQEKIIPLNYWGPLGLDSFIYQKNGHKKVLPISEINPRETLASILHKIQQKNAPNRTLEMGFCRQGVHEGLFPNPFHFDWELYLRKL